MISTSYDIDVMSVLEWIVLSRILSIIAAALSLPPPSTTTTTTTSNQQPDDDGSSSSSLSPVVFSWVQYVLDVVHLILCFMLFVKLSWMFINKYFWWSFLFSSNPCCNNQQNGLSSCSSAAYRRGQYNYSHYDSNLVSSWFQHCCSSLCTLLSGWNYSLSRTVSNICKDIQRLSLWNSRERWYGEAQANDDERRLRVREKEVVENEMVPLLPPTPSFIIDRGSSSDGGGGTTTTTTESLFIGTTTTTRIREKDL